jgi:hypothetical protein
MPANWAVTADQDRRYCLNASALLILPEQSPRPMSHHGNTAQLLHMSSKPHAIDTWPLAPLPESKRW